MRRHLAGNTPNSRIKARLNAGVAPATAGAMPSRVAHHDGESTGPILAAPATRPSATSPRPVPGSGRRSALAGASADVLARERRPVLRRVLPPRHRRV
jgi:hypothetical protein